MQVFVEGEAIWQKILVHDDAIETDFDPFRHEDDRMIEKVLTFDCQCCFICMKTLSFLPFVSIQ